MVTGIVLGIFEIIFIFLGGYFVRRVCTGLQTMNMLSYSWFIVSIVTGFLWETAYIGNYKWVGNYSRQLIRLNQTVWTNEYEFWNVIPNYFSELFYATYAAWADREYMSTTDDWSRVVESSHALFCGMFSLFAVYNYARGNNNEFLITMGIAMGSQVMNSLLYMVEYFIQMDDPNNVNYNNASFPAGIMLSQRAFMWVNIFWLLLPSYTLIYYLFLYKQERRVLTPIFLEKGEIQKQC